VVPPDQPRKKSVAVVDVFLEPAKRFVPFAEYFVHRRNAVLDDVLAAGVALQEITQ
jgi:hypothetical protein